MTLITKIETIIIIILFPATAPAMIDNQEAAIFKSKQDFN